MWSRRAFLRSTGVLSATALTARGSGIEAIVEAAQSVADRTPKEVAQDEFFWREIQFSFTLDRTLTNLNNGNSSPTPRVVHEALKRYLDFSNQLPVFYRGQLAGNIETVRRRLAGEFGCDTEELAITRNASEALPEAAAWAMSFRACASTTSETGMKDDRAMRLSSGSRVPARSPWVTK